MAKGSDTRVWRSGGARRIILAFTFLLLLPFYASLGPMLYQRISRGFVGDTIALAVLGLVFTALMVLLLQQLVHAVRTRVVVDAQATTLTVPDAGTRGPLFLFKYRSTSIPHSNVAAVETRSEVYGGSLTPMLLTSTRVTTKSGDRVVLGYTDANDQEDQIPYTEIGAEIAKRAGTTVMDRGVVRRSVQRRVMGLASGADENVPLPAADIASINTAHARNLRLLVAALAVLVVGGITLDFFTASRTSFAEMGAGLSKVPPAPPKKK